MSDEPITTVIPDFEGDYSRVMPSLVEPGKLIVFTRNTIRKNILENAEVSDQWLGMWPKGFAEGCYIGDSGFILMSNSGHRLTNPDLVSGMGGHATYAEILEDLRNDSDANLRDYKPVTLYRLNAFKRTLGHIFNCRRGYSGLGGKVIVYDYSWMDPMSQVIALIYEMNDCLFKAQHRMYGGRVLLVAEELHRIYRSAAFRGSTLFEPTLLDICRSSVKDGLICIFTDHSVHNSPDDILDTSDTKVFFRLTDRQDLQQIEKALLLHPDLTGKIANFERRHCLYHVSGRMASPEFHQVPDIDFKEYTIEEVEEMMRPHIAKLDYVPADEPSRHPAASPGTSLFIAENERRIKAFLAEHVGHPTKPISVFTKSLPFDVSKSFVHRMAESRLITYPERISFGRVGHGRDEYVEILPRGAALLGRNYGECCIPAGKNKSLKSKIAVASIFLSRRTEAARVALEFAGMDVAEWAGDSVFAYEYEASDPPHPHVVENVTRDLHHAGAARVYVVMDTKKQLDRAKDLLREELSDVDFRRVSFEQTKNYL